LAETFETTFCQKLQFLSRWAVRAMNSLIPIFVLSF
jgi:hypothetical protein